MTRVVVKIEHELSEKLRSRAKGHCRSMEEEVAQILRDAVKADEFGGLGTEISSLFSKVGLKTGMPELRGHKIKPPSFDR